MRRHRDSKRNYDLPIPPEELTKSEVDKWFDELGKSKSVPCDPRWWLLNINSEDV